MTALMAVTVLSAVALLAAGCCLPILAATARPDPDLYRTMPRRWDLRGASTTRRDVPSLVEQASAAARASYHTTGPAGADLRTALSRRFALPASAATITARSASFRSPAAAQAMADAALQPDYIERYRSALAAQLQTRGLAARECWAVAVPGGAAHPGVIAVVTTWLEVALSGGGQQTQLSSTEVILVGGEVCATVTVTGLDVLRHGDVLAKIVSKVSGRLPAGTSRTRTEVPADWLFWPHGS